MPHWIDQYDKLVIDQKHSHAKNIILAATITAIAFLHYLTPRPHYSHKIHIIQRELYYLPPVMGLSSLHSPHKQ
jgi:hypothetical protein